LHRPSRRLASLSGYYKSDFVNAYNENQQVMANKILNTPQKIIKNFLGVKVGLNTNQYEQ
jgi:hypothetical protein